MRFRRLVVAAALAVSIGGAAPARALSQGEEAGFSLLATWANVLYFPAKLVVTAVAFPVGALAGWLGGGNERSAYAIWVPAAGGTWFLGNDHLSGRTPIEFFGSDYADRPSSRYATAVSDTYTARYDEGM